MEILNERAARVAKGLFPNRTVPGEERRTQPVAERMAYWGVPAVSVAVINDGAIEWSQAWGVKSAASGGDVDVRTLFQAGSISKAVGAIGALSLVESGHLSLDEPIDGKLTSCEVRSFVPTWKPRVTVRQVLDHSAGFTVHGFPGYQRTQPIPHITEVINGGSPANTGPVRVAFAPGTRFLYSGGAYSVLQQLMVDATGEQFADLLQRLVFEPLGMQDSTFEQPLPESLWPRAASGHERGATVIAGDWYVFPELAAAGLWTTASDLARFGLALQETLRFGKPHPVLSSEMVNLALTASATSSGTWGLGFMLRGRPDGQTFGHSGGNTGFIADLQMHRDFGSGVAVMTNGLSGGEVMYEVENAVATEYGWPGHLPEDFSLKFDGDQTEFESIEGTYELEDGRLVEILRTGAQAVLRIEGQAPLTLGRSPSGELWAEALALQLEPIASDGVVEEVVIKQAANRLTAKRQSDAPGDDQ